MSKILLATAFICTALISQSQTILIQEDFNGGIPTSWQVIDADGHNLHSSMTAFTDAWISYVDGTDSVAASSSYFDDTLYAADYLILPKQSLQTFSKFSWESRTVDPAYPDGYYVLLSTTDSNITSFTDTLMTVYAEFYQWNRKSIWLDTMGYANQDVFIAFQNMTQDGFILLLDDIWLEVSDFASIQSQPELEIDIYPNPTTDLIKVKSDETFELSVFDLVGEELMSTYGNEVDVSTLSTGKYILMISTENGITSRPFIKL